MTALRRQNPGALPSSLLSRLPVAVGALRQSVVVCHLPHSASLPSPHGKAIRAVGRAGSSGAGAGWSAAAGAGSELQLYYGSHQSGRQVTAWLRCVEQSRPRVCWPAKTGKVISLVTATNWNHDVRGAGMAAVLITARVASAQQTNPTSQSHALLSGLSLEVSQPEGIIPSDIASLLRFPGQALNTSKTDTKTVLVSQSFSKAPDRNIYK